MFNSVVLDVFIGLVLVYLLYSLFITIISEMIVTWMALRSRILRVAIEKMLNDGYHYKSIVNAPWWTRAWNFVQRYFLKEFDDFKYSFAGKFYNNPSIKYLSSKAGEQKTPFSQTKPSYISADMFATTLIQLLKDKGNGATDMDKIIFCVRFNTHNVEDSTLKHLRDIVEDAGGDMNLLTTALKNWYNETMDRCTGWYKRKLQLILFWLGFIAASIFNVDTVAIVRLLAKDKDARNQLVNMGIQLSKDTSRYAPFLKDKHDSLPQAILDSGYAHITKDISDAGMVLGLGWSKKRDTSTAIVEYAFIKQEDSVLFKKAAKVSALFIRERDSLRSMMNTTAMDAATITAAEQRADGLAVDSFLLARQVLLITDTLPGSAGRRVRDSLSAKLDTVSLAIKNGKEYIGKLRRLSSADSALLITQARRVGRIAETIDSLAEKRFDQIKVVQPSATAITVKGEKKKVTTVPMSFGNWVVKILGISITALMLSLGAPFWFDLLKKLVAIRGAGVKPEEKKQEKDKKETVAAQASQKAIYNTDDPVEIALSKYKKSLETIPGVLAVQYDYEIIGTTKTPCIEVVVAGHCNKKLIPAQYKVTVNDIEHTVPVVIKDGQLAELHVLPDASLLIKNSFHTNPAEGWGSVTGVVHNKRTNQHAILSCSHVMGGNNSGNVFTGVRDIIRNNNSPAVIATLTFNEFSNSFDVAYADIPANTTLPYTTINKFDEVIKQDGEFETEVLMQGTVSGNVGGRILHHRAEYPFMVDGKPFTIVNLIKVAKKVNNQNAGLSQRGDSGSLLTKTDGTPIGMIIGGTTEFSFAISFKEIFGLLFIEPIKT
jgi:hypothetical protein